MLTAAVSMLPSFDRLQHCSDAQLQMTASVAVMLIACGNPDRDELWRIVVRCRDLQSAREMRRGLPSA
jgi:hypothetical protein